MAQKPQAYPHAFSLPNVVEQPERRRADPTRLTHEAIVRAVQAERDYLDGQISTLVQRLDCMDQTMALLRELLESRIESCRRETRLLLESSERAISKAEAANEKRFEEVDQWRTLQIDRERTEQEQLSALLGTFIPREVAEAQIAELRRTVADLSTKMNRVIE